MTTPSLFSHRRHYLRATAHNAAGLPDVMIVKASYVATRVEDLLDFFRAFDPAAPLSIANGSDPGHVCSFATVRNGVQRCVTVWRVCSFATVVSV